MRVVRAASSTRWRLPRPAVPAGRAARIERLGLAATSIVLLFGLTLTAAGQLATTASCSGAPGCVNLNAVDRAADLVPVLTMFPAEEREALAPVLAAALVEQRTTGGALAHVGALAALQMPADAVRRSPRLASMNTRLRARPQAERIAVLSGAELAALKPRASVRAREDYLWRVVGLTALFMASFWLLHGLRWWLGTTGDAVLLPAVQLIAGLGLMTLLALRDPLRDMPIAWTMAGGIAVGCLIWAVVSVIDFERPALRRAVLVPLGLAVALAAALLLFGSGPAGSGARVNLLGAQPVEVIRPLVVFALAAYFARRWQFLRAFSEKGGPAPVRRFVRMPRWKDVRPLAVTLATLLLFFFLQRDLGPALVLACVFLGLYGVARGHAALVAAGFLVLAAGFAAGYALGIPATVAQRVAMWLDPWENALRGGDQIAHALWALASGGAWGLGSGVGDPHVIPAGHTDLVFAALGEELGLVGVIAVVTTFALIVWRMLAIALRAPGDYTMFLAAGLAIALAAQAIVIVAGQLDLLPLAGVVTPFMSFGRSSMISNLAAVAVVAAIARRQSAARVPFAAPLRAMRWTLAAAALVLLVRAGQVQTLAADDMAAASVLTQQADGGLRYQQNPRLVSAAQEIPRGTIFDRTGLPLATDDPQTVLAASERLRALGLQPVCAAGRRCYPLGGAAFHLLGHAESRLNWAASNTAYAEQQFDAVLSGFDDRARIVEVRHPRDGRVVRALRRDYRALLPLVRHKGDPTHPDVRRILETARDVHLSVDAGLQLQTARAIRAQALAAGSGRAAAVVIDPRSGELLAAASYPWPDDAEMRGSGTPAPATLLDRARFGLYPPGSTFKLVTAAAALRAGAEHGHASYQCVRLPDGRVGNRVNGATVRDDVQDTVPHGTVDLDRALVVSCNAYFAQLANRIGAGALGDTAAAARITVASPAREERLRRTLSQAGYGQGDVVATPQRMARVVAAVALDGRLREVTMQRRPDGTGASDGTAWLDRPGAERLRRDMRAVVTSGTGRSLASHHVAIGGKTGTAEIDGDRSHGWFVGYAPHGGTAGARIAFAVIVENGGYGGRVATPVAGAIVTAAAERGLLRPPPVSAGDGRGTGRRGETQGTARPERSGTRTER